MRLICFGDSNTWGYDPRSYIGERYAASERWVDLLAAKTGCECVNLGENGRRIPTRPLNIELDEDERLLVMLGTNDILSGLDAGECAHRLVEFLEPCPRGRALIIAPPPLQRGSWVDSTAEIGESLELPLLYSAAAGRLHQSFADAGRWGVELCFDGVHFTAAGHRAFAQGVADVVENMK